jgi:hypothetical protein
MRSRVFLALALAFLGRTAAARSAPLDAEAAKAPRLPDLRCFSVQGHCVPGATPVGQTAASPHQIHNVLVGGWNPSARILSQAVWKHVAVSEEWVAAARILPVAVHCDTYLAFVKGQAGVPQELWCIDGTRVLLLWEMLDAAHGRYWTRQDGSMGIVLFDGRYPTGTYLLNTTDEQLFTCLGGSAVPGDLVRNVADIEAALGPFDISTSRSRSSTLALLRSIEVVPDAAKVPDDVALPPSWTQEGLKAGNLSGRQPVSLFLLQGFWGGIACPEGSNVEACTSTAMNRETVWLVRVGNESSGYERWMDQRMDGNAGGWGDPVAGNIGTTAAVVAEGEAPLLPAVPCRN